MDKTSIHGKYWYSAERVPDIVEMVSYMRDVYDYLKDIPKYRAVKEAGFIRNDTFDEVAELFPKLEEFRIKYGMHKRVTYLEYKGRHTYLLPPHDHEAVGHSMFFPIYYSDYAGTAFYEPTAEELVESKPLKVGLAIGDSPTNKRYSCSLDVTPIEVVGGNRPMLFNTLQLHTAYEWEIGHPANYTRVSITWDSPVPFTEMISNIS